MTRLNEDGTTREMHAVAKLRRAESTNTPHPTPSMTAVVSKIARNRRRPTFCAACLISWK
jgi:hypothetical protein